LRRKNEGKKEGHEKKRKAVSVCIITWEREKGVQTEPRRTKALFVGKSHSTYFQSRWGKPLEGENGSEANIDGGKRGEMPGETEVLRTKRCVAKLFGKLIRTLAAN